MSQPPDGYREIPPEDRKKAKSFFDRGSTVAGTGQYDYAIEMFMQGLSIDPDSVEAHQTLRDISLRRKASGGKALGMMDKFKLKKGDDKQNMLNAEKLLAYEPGSTEHMHAMMQNAYRAGFYDTVLWAGPMLYKAIGDSGKPDLAKFTSLKDTYKALGQWKLAIDACQSAVSLRPDDMDLIKELKDLGAQHTMSAGKYGTGGSFRDSVKDMSGQQKLMDQDKDVRTDDLLGRQIADAEAEYKAQPNESGKLMKLVEILVKSESVENENRAIDLLTTTFETSKQFRFRQNVGKIRLRQLERADRSYRDKLRKSPTDEGLREEYRTFLNNKLEEELTEFQLWAENYPTDQAIKYEVARRMFALHRYGEAIPVFQTARQDPKIRTDATIQLARAFFEAEFVDEAIDTLRALIEEYQLKGDERSKEMYYWFARALEKQGDVPAAIKAFSQVAQWDFNYRDVQQRIKALRAAPK